MSAGAGSKPAPPSGSSLSKRFEIPFGIETQLFGVSDHLDLRVPENLVDHVFRDVEVLEVKRVRDADEARLCGGRGGRRPRRAAFRFRRVSRSVLTEMNRMEERVSNPLLRTFFREEIWTSQRCRG